MPSLFFDLDFPISSCYRNCNEEPSDEVILLVCSRGGVGVCVGEAEAGMRAYTEIREVPERSVTLTLTAILKPVQQV